MNLINSVLVRTRLLLIINLSILLLVLPIANAQSGRKIPKTPTRPPETAQPKETPPEESKPAKVEPQIKLMVVYQQQSLYTPRVYSDLVAEGCLDRLQKSLSVGGQFGREMNRKEASDFAKASSGVYVLWFQLETDSFDPDSSNRNNVQSLYVNYALYAPGTGKIQTSGHVYQNQRGMISRPVPQNPMTAEYSLRRAGSDLTDRILKTLNLPLPPNYD